MQIGLLTLPLNVNYGGILQAYALKKVLEMQGHSVILLDFLASVPRRLPIKTRYLVYAKRFFEKCFLGRKLLVCQDKYDRDSYLNTVSEINKFVFSYIQSVDYEQKNIKQRINLDAIVVGSDQVWRPAYAVPIEKYFLNFFKPNLAIRIAYAASFGTDEWEFTPEQTERCSALVQKFNLVTVREDSAIDLCREYLRVEAIQVLDPTMLLDKEDYVHIIQQQKVLRSKGNLFSYMLDDDERKQSLVLQIAQQKGLNPFSIIPKDGKADGVFPSVPVWLRSFLDAEFIVTDSFHGCVFSIIFNKPFVAVGNAQRGQARFDSLFRLFHLQERLIDVADFSVDVTAKEIDWDGVNAIWKEMKQKSICLLFNNLRTSNG